MGGKGAPRSCYGHHCPLTVFVCSSGRVASLGQAPEGGGRGWRGPRERSPHDPDGSREGGQVDRLTSGLRRGKNPRHYPSCRSLCLQLTLPASCCIALPLSPPAEFAPRPPASGPGFPTVSPCAQSSVFQNGSRPSTGNFVTKPLGCVFWVPSARPEIFTRPPGCLQWVPASGGWLTIIVMHLLD